MPPTMRILIVKLGSIGDVVHTLPALAALRRAYPRAHIAWAVESGGPAKLLRDNPCLDDLLVLNMRGWRKTLAEGQTRGEITAAIRRLRGFDLALDFQGLLKSAAIARLSGAPRRIGFARAALREPASAWLLTETVNVDDSDQIIRKNLQLVRALGIEPGDHFEFPIALAPEDEQFAEQQLSAHNGALAIINPGGGWPTKLWNTAGFAAIADRLREQYGLPSVITYGPGEQALAESVAAASRTGAQPLDTTLKQFFALARRARLFVGGDTGPLHLAAAAGAPILGIYGPTPARRNGPFAPDDIVVERFDLDCRTDCFRRSCGHTSCMNIPVETVWQAAVKRMRKKDVRCQMSDVSPP
ncbi:MAG: glycosyltransferase family 9 protein [Blastocatellia bacterium]